MHNYELKRIIGFLDTHNIISVLFPKNVV